MVRKNKEQEYYYGAYADAENYLVSNSYYKISEFCTGRSNSIHHKFSTKEEAENWINLIPGYFDFSSLKDYELVVVSTNISKNYEKLLDVFDEEGNILKTKKYASYYYMLALLDYIQKLTKERGVKKVAITTTDRVAVYYMDLIYNHKNTTKGKSIKKQLVNKIKELRETLDITFFTFDDERKNEQKKYLEEVKNEGSDKYVLYGRTK